MENSNNNFKWTKELIQQCLDNKNHQKLNIKDKLDDTGFSRSCQIYPELAETMLGRGNINFNLQNNRDETRFMTACKYQPELLKEMLNRTKIDKTLKKKDDLTGYDIAK